MIRVGRQRLLMHNTAVPPTIVQSTFPLNSTNACAPPLTLTTKSEEVVTSMSPHTTGKRSSSLPMLHSLLEAWDFSCTWLPS